MDPIIASRIRNIVIVGVVFVVVVGGALRLSPWCVANAGSFGWNTWTRAFPNLACSLDLSELVANVSAEELDARLPAFKNVQSLNLSRKGLTAIPQSVYGLTQLTSLIFADNQLTVLDAGITALGGLEHLDVSGNHLQSLPGSISGLVSLQNLNVSGNALTTLPPELGGIETLTEVDVSGNDLDPDEEEEIEDALPDVTVTFESSSSSSSTTSTENDVTPPASGSSASATEASSATSLSGGGASSQGTATAQASSSATVQSQSSGQSSSAQAASSDEPGIQSLEPSTSSSLAAMASESSASSPIAIPGPLCTLNFSVNGFSFCVPLDWTQNAGVFKNGQGDIVARLNCPIAQKDYQAWTLTTQSRTYLHGGAERGAELWSGTPKEEGGSPMLIIFMHLHDFNSWYGTNYADVARSCQIEAADPEGSYDAFHLLFLSVD